MHILYNPEILNLRELYAHMHKEVCSRIFMGALLLITKFEVTQVCMNRMDK